MSIVRCWAALEHNPVNEFNESPLFAFFSIFFFPFSFRSIDLVVKYILRKHPLGQFFELIGDHGANRKSGEREKKELC